MNGLDFEETNPETGVFGLVAWSPENPLLSYSDLKIPVLSSTISENEACIKYYQEKPKFMFDQIMYHVKGSELPIEDRFVKFEHNFYKFYRSFIGKNCAVCNLKNKLALCLLCGETVCVRSCDPKAHEDSMVSKLRSQLVGNAAKHSFQRHNGICVFVVSDDGDVILYEGSRVFVYSSIFVNKYGQHFDTDTKSYGSFEKYSLNRDKFLGFLQAVQENQVIYNILESNIKHELHYIDN